MIVLIRISVYDRDLQTDQLVIQYSACIAAVISSVPLQGLS